MNTAVYARYELLRTFRNLRCFGFSLAFPLILFLLVAGPNRHEELDGIAFPVYYMSGMVAWGTMTAIVASGARIAAERAVGWNRQLRITRSRPRPTSGPRWSPATPWPWPASPCSTRPGRPSACASTPGGGSP